MFRSLLAHPEVTEEATLATSVGVMALHAGIESGTGILAERIAERTGASRYLVTQSPSLRWHVPSTQYDPCASIRLSAFLHHVDFVVSLHGFGRKHLPRTILVGGADADVSVRIAGHLRRTTSMNILVGEDVPRGLRGRHPDNPVNLASQGGVQLELSATCRQGELGRELVESVSEFITAELW